MQIAPLLNIGRGVTALIGGGGKTTLLYTLTEELRKKGTVLLCTSTHIMRPTQYEVLERAGEAEISAALSAHGAVCVGEPSAEGKLGPPSLSFDALARLADYVLVEADGSRRLPLKAHAPHEPVIPANAQRVVLVVGADGFGKPIRDVCHRSERYAALCGVSEAFLGHERVEGGNAGLGHRLRTGHLHALIHGFALAEHGQRHVSERREVAGGAEGALLGNDGGNALVEHLEKHLNEEGAHAAHAAAQGVGAQEHHAAHDLVGIRLAGGGAVAEDQVGGEGVGHLLRHRNLGKVAEAGGDAVGHAALGGDLLGERAGLLHRFESGRGQLDRGVVARDGDKGFKRQAVAVDHNVLDRGGIHDHGSCLFS